MTLWCLVAPGPSASAEDVARVVSAGIPIGAVGNAFQLTESPAFIAAADAAWWRKYPEAKKLPGKKFSIHEVRDVGRIRVPGWSICNSGVLGLECAKREGATKILLIGFDMHGTHFFGKYTNGLANTNEIKRRLHLKQYENWASKNPEINVVNCTAGSALKSFPMGIIADFA
ncbi:MAG: hypothetical protein V4628_11500 [Pseudomonadota bacterium]